MTQPASMELYPESQSHYHCLSTGSQVKKPSDKRAPLTHPAHDFHLPEPEEQMVSEPHHGDDYAER